eukprot:scaffold20405_cov129-Isochrysis_galbana.AAC.2
MWARRIAPAGKDPARHRVTWGVDPFGGGQGASGLLRQSQRCGALCRQIPATARYGRRKRRCMCAEWVGLAP